MWKKKTNNLQVYPYKPVSWSSTHQGILLKFSIANYRRVLDKAKLGAGIKYET